MHVTVLNKLHDEMVAIRYSYCLCDVMGYNNIVRNESCRS